MRSEREMLELVLDFARQNEAVRVVVMNGSRVNPKATPDPFQDFDICYYVSDVAQFVRNPLWIDPFGERIILQMPEAMGDAESKKERNQFSYLMLFTDGNRIDLSLMLLSDISRIGEDSLTMVLLDKDGVVGSLPPPSEQSYLPKQPTAKAFADCCNEFWWVSTYVAKALWRQNAFQAKDLLECVLRQELMKMLDWYFGIKTNYMVNPGKMGKLYSKHLEPDLIDALKKTYVDLDSERNWDALFAMSDLFPRAATKIAEHFGFEYPIEDDRKVTAHLEHVRRLPPDAKEIS